MVQERLAIIEPEIGKLQTVVQCPSCLQRAINADGGTEKCLFCHSPPEPSQAAEEDATNVLGYRGRFSVEKDGGQWPIRISPECGHDTFVTVVLGRFDAYASIASIVASNMTRPNWKYAMTAANTITTALRLVPTSVQVVFMGEYRMTMSRSTQSVGRQKGIRTGEESCACNETCSLSRVNILCRSCEIGRWTRIRGNCAQF